MRREERIIQHIYNTRAQLNQILGEELVTDILQTAKELRMIKSAIFDQQVTDVKEK